MKLDGWIEVFRAGAHPGHRPFTVAEVEAIAKSYDPTFHEAPVVIGHPKTDAPAWGWIEKLEAAGGVLRAKLKQVSPEFAELVASGRFKKRSAAFYLDLGGRGLYLRHVGFLGAEPPAVKGLSPAFEEDGGAGGEVVEIEYEEERNRMTLEEWKKALDERLAQFAESFGLKKKPAGDKPEDTSFAEAVKAAKAELKQETDAQFAELRKTNETLTAESKGLRDELAAQRKQTETTGATAFAEKALQAGKLTPALKPVVVALAGMLAGQTETVEFGEGEAKADKTGLALLEQLVGGLPKTVHFGERTGGLGTTSKVVEMRDGAEVHNADVAELADKIADEEKVEYSEALAKARKQLRKAG
ncbi:MAG: hypothetical protein KDC27_19200 [Acidobacteria bacterium]|nr:hypothetical protein [Acidobacteriota bacterium]